jgi:hypothetical protein
MIQLRQQTAIPALKGEICGRLRENGLTTGKLERFRAKACPGLDPGWTPVRVKKTRQNKN